MTGFDMFSEFIDILKTVFELVFVSKYSIAFLALFVVLGGSFLIYIVRWFNRA